MTIEQLASKVVGLDYEMARYAIKALGFWTRVVELDGRHFTVTRDYRTDRINFYIKNNKIVMTSIG